jgi:hypothetical protein
MSERLDRDTFFVNQKHAAWGKSKYYVFDDAGAPLFYVERPVKPFQKADISVYHDDSKREHVLTIRQDHRYAALRREYTLVDMADGHEVGRFKRDNIKSLFRRHWEVSNGTSAAIAHAREDSVALAAVRRILEWVPYVGIVTGFIRTNFQISVIQDSGTEVRVSAAGPPAGAGARHPARHRRGALAPVATVHIGCSSWLRASRERMEGATRRRSLPPSRR